jgi:hypothetical protein
MNPAAGQKLCGDVCVRAWNLEIAKGTSAHGNTVLKVNLSWARSKMKN